MTKTYSGNLSGAGRKIGIVISRTNDFIGNHLLDGAKDTLLRQGVLDDDISIAYVPGAFEIPVLAKKMSGVNGLDAVICLGAVIRGGTPHFDYIAAEVSKGVAAVALEAPIPIIFGVLTTDTIEQAIERSGTKSGNKGREAALAALELIDLYGQLK